MASLYDLTIGEETQLRRVLNAAGLDDDVARLLIAKPQLAAAMVTRFAMTQMAEALTPSGRFILPGEQIENLKAWNVQKRWGFTADHFERARAACPKMPQDKHVALTLVPYPVIPAHELICDLWECVLDSQDCINQNLGWVAISKDSGLLDPAIYITQSTYGVIEIQYSGDLPPATPPVLRWEYLNLTGVGISDVTLRAVAKNKPIGPFFGVLAAAAHFPMWLRLTDGKRLPIMAMPGCAVVTRTGDRRLLKLSWRKPDKVLTLQSDAGFNDHGEYCIARYSGESVTVK